MASNNPYIGPRTFQRNEGHLFFGREREARDLIALVASERLVVFYAQSGAGKSSIVNTRLIPNLESKEYEVLPAGRLSGDLTASDGVDNIYVHNLIRSLEQHDTDPKALASLTLSDFLAHINYDDKGFFYDPTPVEVDPNADPSDVARRALIIDQFEELFSTYPESWDKRADFFEQLAKAMEDDPQLWVVLVMREDYIAAVDPYAHLVPNGLRVRYYMQRLSREAALKAVKSPVEGLRPYAEDVAEKLIDDLCSIKVQKPDGRPDIQPGQYVEPVQMQVVCYGLWDNLPDEGQEITAQDLQDVGDVNQSLGKYYDKRVGEVAEAKNVRERLIREWFEKKLITAGGIRSMVLQELEPKPGELHDDVIQALQSDLVRAEKRGGATWYELTHDRLVEPVLERNEVWFEENLSPLQRQAALWKDEEQNDNWLLTGDALNDVEAWASEHQDELTDVEHEFLTSCRKAQKIIDEQEKAERQRLEMAQKIAEEQARSAKKARQFSWIAGVLVILALIASGFAIFNSNQAESAKLSAQAASTQAVTEKQNAENAQQTAQDQAKKALAGDLISRASDLESQQPDLAALLNLEAYQLNKNDGRTQKSVITSLQDFAGRYSFLDQVVADPGQGSTLQFSPDGTTAAVLDNDGGITLWDLKNQKKINPKPIKVNHYNAVYPVAFSHDGSILASGSQDGTLILWNAKTGDQLTKPPLEEHTAWLNSISFSPKGNILATSSDDQTVILWGWPDGEPEKIHKISVLRGHNSWIGNVIFSSDGNKLASSDSDGNIFLWNIKDHQKPIRLKVLRYQGNPNLYGMAFGKGDKILAAIDPNGKVVLWNMNDPENPEPFESPIEDNDSPIRALALSPNGTTLAIRVTDSTDNSLVKFWNIEDPSKPIEMMENQINDFEGNKFKSNHIFWDNYLDSLTFSPDGKVLALDGCDSDTKECYIYRWNTSSYPPRELGKPIHTIAMSNSIAINRDGNMLAAGNIDGSISRWDLSKINAPTSIFPPLKGHIGKTTSISFSPDGHLLSLSAPEANDYFLIKINPWDADTQGVIGTGKIEPSYTDPEGTTALYHFYDEKTGGELNQIMNITTGEDMYKPFPGTYMAISPSKEVAVYKTYDEAGDVNINLWDVMNGATIKTDISKGNPIDKPSFSNDGKILVFQEADEDSKTWIHLIDTSTGSIVASPIQGTFQNFSTDGKLMFYTVDAEDGSYLEGWNIPLKASDPRLHFLDGTYQAMTQDGKLLIYTTGDQINIFDIQTGASTLSQSGNVLAISPDKKKLIYQVFDTAANTNVINILDLTTGKQVPLKKHLENISAGSFSADNKILGCKYDSPDTQQSYLCLIDLASGNVIDSKLPGDPLTDVNGKLLIYNAANKNTLAYLSYLNGNDSYIGILDMATGKSLGIPVKATYSGVSPDHKTLVYQIPASDPNSGNPTLGLLDMTTGIGIDTQKNINYQNFTPDSKKIIYLNSDSPVKMVGMLDAATGETLGKTTLSGTYLDYTAAGNLIAARDSNGKVDLWNMPQDWILGERLQTQPPWSRPIQKAILSSQGDLLASISDNAIYLQNLSMTDDPHPVDNKHAGGVKNVVFNGKDTSSFLTIGEDGHVILRKLGEDLFEILPIPGTDAFFSPDGKTIIVLDQHKNLTSFISMENRKIVSQVAGQPLKNCGKDSNEALLPIQDTNAETTVLLNLSNFEQAGNSLSATALPSSKCKYLAISDDANNKTSLVDLGNVDFKTMDITGRYLQFSSDDKFLLTMDTSNNYKLIAWRLTANQAPQRLTGFSLKAFSGGTPYFSPKDTYLFLANTTENRGTSTSVVWNLERDTLAREIPNNESVSDPKFSPDEKYLAINGQEFLDLTQPQKLIESISSGTILQFSPQGRYLAITDGYNSLRLHDLVQNKDLLPPLITSPDREIKFSPDDTYLAVSDKDSFASDNTNFSTSLYKLDGDSLSILLPIPGDVPQFDENGWFLVTSKSVLNLSSENNSPLSIDKEDTILPDDFKLKDSLGGNKMAIFSGKGASIWDAQSPKSRGKLLDGHKGFIETMVISPLGNILATIASDGIILTDISDPFHETQKNAPAIPGNSVAFSSDGTIFVVSDDTNKQTILYNTKNLQLLYTVKTADDPSAGDLEGAFSPNGKYLITKDPVNDKTRVWDLTDTTFTHPIQEIPGIYTAFSSAGNFLAVFDITYIQKDEKYVGSSSLWDISASKPIVVKDFKLDLPCGSDCIHITFSSDGRYMAYNDGNAVKLLDAITKEQIGSIPVENAVQNLSFIPAGTLDSSDTKTSILVIDDTNAESLAEFTLWEVPSMIDISNPIPGTFVGTISDSIKNTIIYLSSDTNELIEWDVTPSKWEDQLCSIVSRNPSRIEWDQYTKDVVLYSPVCPKLPFELDILQNH